MIRGYLALSVICACFPVPYYVETWGIRIYAAIISPQTLLTFFSLVIPELSII